eukprot:TRINITY_DN67413_c0_g1_i1.p2 TRINITY_DN67413_c0_g1~~TRINITY_DN67413_c0_g1_i1.p2  ORF type:complete len:118 (+),score=4.88 TRINITY_DN67413_c0_g1_i1:203-556(+)
MPGKGAGPAAPHSYCEGELIGYTLLVARFLRSLCENCRWTSRSPDPSSKASFLVTKETRVLDPVLRSSSCISSGYIFAPQMHRRGIPYGCCFHLGRGPQVYLAFVLLSFMVVGAHHA